MSKECFKGGNNPNNKQLRSMILCNIKFYQKITSVCLIIVLLYVQDVISPKGENLCLKNQKVASTWCWIRKGLV